MGRNAGFIALWCGITNGAEMVLIPEKERPTDEEIIREILQNKQRGKKHFLIITAEGVGGSQDLAVKIEKLTGIETRATILGYLQRGGSPSAVDRMHASMMGAMAVDLLCEGKSNRVIAYRGGQYVDYDINEALKMKKSIDERMYEVAKILSI
jgi:6-phosphofructokinase 1